MSNPPPSFVTSYCNHPHRLRDGKPIQHNCYILPREALRYEMQGRHADAWAAIEAAKPLIQMRRGVRR